MKYTSLFVTVFVLYHC